MEEKARIKKQNCKKGFKKNEHAFSMDGVQRPRGWADAQHRSMHVEMGWGQACGWLFGNVGRLFLCGGCENCIAARGGCGGVTLLRCCCCMKTAKSAWGLHESALAWTGDSSMESYCVMMHCDPVTGMYVLCWLPLPFRWLFILKLEIWQQADAGGHCAHHRPPCSLHAASRWSWITEGTAKDLHGQWTLLSLSGSLV